MRRSRTACASVPLSTYSSSPPTGTPRASRLTLSPLDGIGPREIHLDRLISRALDGVVEEVILATNFTPEGEATAHTIGELLKARGLKVSRLARGVPVGGELEYVDSGTLAQAVRDRRTV